MAILTPTAGAFVGTAWAVSHPSETIRNGLVVAEPSFGRVLVLALAGGVAVVMIVTTLIFWAIFVYERVALPAFHRHGAWQPIFNWLDSPSSDPDHVAFQLACRLDPPVPATSLGYVECWVQRPTGEIEVFSGENVNCSIQVSLADELPATPAAHVWYNLRGMYGQHEVRWYGTGRRRYEIARAKFDIQSSEQESAPPAS